MADIHLYYITGDHPKYFTCWRCWEHDLPFFARRAKFTWKGSYLGQEYILIFAHVSEVSQSNIDKILSGLTQTEAENEKAQY